MEVEKEKEEKVDNNEEAKIKKILFNSNSNNNINNVRDKKKDWICTFCKNLNYSFLSNLVKGKYFIYSAIKALQNPTILKKVMKK